MNEERRMVLQMIQEGIITAEEGAALLSAMQGGDNGPTRTARGQLMETPVMPFRWVRIRVIDKVTERTRVNLSIPIGLLDWGLRLAESMGGVNVTRFRNLIFSGLNGGELLNVDSEESNERVIITME
ncbi:MAG: hypothetical protein KDD73_11470 [Anaerolineales bacterium]|nr:hypothetical protein [Anaerolineales bacterium]MCB9127565.1 hypothetical protein [Ardenticatenales bacterium]